MILFSLGRTLESRFTFPRPVESLTANPVMYWEHEEWCGSIKKKNFRKFAGVNLNMHYIETTQEPAKWMVKVRNQLLSLQSVQVL